MTEAGVPTQPEPQRVGLFAYHSASSDTEINAWVKRYDPDAFDGGGDVEFTSDPAEALSFATVSEALTFWKQVSTVRPVREDGKPNRPLTAFTTGVQPLPDVPTQTEPQAPGEE